MQSMPFIRKADAAVFFLVKSNVTTRRSNKLSRVAKKLGIFRAKGPVSPFAASSKGTAKSGCIRKCNKVAPSAIRKSAAMR